MIPRNTYRGDGMRAGNDLVDPQRFHDERPDGITAVLATARPRWMVQAACAGRTELMYPRRGQSLDAALDLCWSCVVLPECSTWAITTDPDPLDGHGIAAGMTANARRRARAHHRKEHP